MMLQISEKMEPYKQAAMECIKTYWDYDYDEYAQWAKVVEPDVLLTEERVLMDVMEELSQTMKASSELDEYDELIHYVNFGDLVQQLDKDELIEGLLNKDEIREVEAQYSYGLHLREKIERELSSLDLKELHTFTEDNPATIIHPSTGEVEFGWKGPVEQEDSVYYETCQFVSRGSEFHAPERNIFCGHRFCEAPIRSVTREEYLEYLEE